MTSARLRILATTDLHAHALGWDYFRDEARHDIGLASLVPLIRRARRECPDTLLLDNGDFLQGSPLGDWTVECGRGGHPMIAMMNALGYDAATLGNHEFSHGLDLLQDALSQAQFAVVSANMTVAGLAGLQRDVLLVRQVGLAGGGTHPLCIGVTGTAPPQTTTWEARNLQGRLTATDTLDAARAAVASLRARGADIVVLLAHTGIGDAEPGSDDMAVPLAEQAGADVLILGHAHQTYPEGAPTLPVPAVMPGCFGSHLGCIDLELDHGPDGWALRRATPHLLRPDADRPAPADSAPRATLDAHDAARAWLRQPVGQCDRPLRGHFARIAPCDMIHLIAAAQADHVQRSLSEAEIDGRPVLAAAAPFRIGTRSAAGGCSDIPAGPLTLRQVNDLYPHPNTIVALAVTGAEIADWLERAAIQFTLLDPNKTDQPLLRTDTPAFDFDMIDGLSFRIDPTAAPRFDHRGTLVAPTSRRIGHLFHRGMAVRESDRFILATNSYRAAGSGGFPACRADRILLDDGASARKVLAAFVASGRPWRPQDSWHLAPLGLSVLFDASAGAERYLSDIDHLQPRLVSAPDGSGPHRFRLRL